MSQPPSLDLVSVITALMGALIGQQLAPYASAYLVIMLAWFGGVQVGIYRRDVSRSRMSTLSFVCTTLVLALGITGVVSAALGARLGIENTWLLFPVAFAIPAVGDSWIEIAAWAWGLWKARKEREQ